MRFKSSHHKALYKLFTQIASTKEAAQLLADLLTPQELNSLSERWQIIQELSKGTTQREIAKKLHISIAKVSRGSRILHYGAGGFLHFLKKMRLNK